MHALKKALSACLFLLALSCAWAQTNVDFTRTEDVIYGRKFGTALTLDVFDPDIVKDMEFFADWFDEHLRGIKPKS